MSTFITPYSGSSQLTASNGLTIVEQGLWLFSHQGYNDGATFGVSLSNHIQTDAGLLHLNAMNWTIPEIGNELTSYTDPDTQITYTADQCRITVTGQWLVTRQPNTNSINSIGVLYTGTTETDQGSVQMYPWLLEFDPKTTSYVIQGADVDGGAMDTFSEHDFFCKIYQTITTDNSNSMCQSNSIVTPIFYYTYSKSWQTS